MKINLKYEYTILLVKGEDVISVLNKMGNDGWENYWVRDIEHLKSAELFFKKAVYEYL